MKQLIGILLVCWSAFSQDIHQELIVGGYDKREIAEVQLAKLDIYFMENGALDALRKKYALKTAVRRIGEYEVVGIAPIDSMDLKNRLLLKLHPFFPGIFFIESKLPTATERKTGYATVTKPRDTASVMNTGKNKDMIDQMGLQWFAILMLSVTGLVLSVFRRKKVLYLQKIQKILGRKQHKIEDEIKHMESVHA